MKLGIFFVLLGLYFLVQVMVVVGYGTDAEGIGYLVGYSFLPVMFVIYGAYRIKKDVWGKRDKGNKK